MNSVRLHTSVLLKHILESEFEIEKKQDAKLSKLQQEESQNNYRPTIKRHEDILDFDGPKLMLGAKNWLTLYKIVGIVNFNSLPLWMSIIYKLLVLSCTIGILHYRWTLKILNLSIVKGSFRNPILLFISVLAVVTIMIQFFVNIRTNLFNLCPLYKILTTPKLCFIQEEALHFIGTDTLNLRIFMHLLYALCGEMVAERNLGEFIKNFNVIYFILDSYASTVLYYHVYGLIQLDFYIRLAFGHWLLALKSHMEQQFAMLHKSGTTDSDIVLDRTRAARGGSNARPFRTITFDEIQKNFNHMDDHLEVLRSVFGVSLVLITLVSFLGTGGLCLLIYHLVVNESEYYHSILLLILSLLSMYSLFSTYGGDRWVFFALSSFVQSVEDEYFLQEDNRHSVIAAQSSRDFRQQAGAAQPTEVEANNNNNKIAEPQRSIAESNKQMLLVRKKDVLFCREFLHQFENHLATPWSKLTFKSHLHMMRTFVTLVAAQIIFEHEH